MRLALSLSLASVAAVSVFACSFDPDQGFGDTGSGGRYVTPGSTGTGNTIVKDPGQCIRDPGSDACMSVCAAESHVPSMLPPDLLIVLDKSGSMNESTDNMMNCLPPTCDSKWVQVTAAINNVVGATAAKVNWGLKYFGDGSGNDLACGVSANVAVGIAANNAAPISQSIAMTTPGSNTPTRAGVAMAVEYLKTLKDPNPKYILLATDGQPNCAASTGGRRGGGATTPDDAAAIAAVKAAFTAGFPTFVVGISLGGDSLDTLNSMAKEGGVPSTGATAFYSVAGTNDLVKALESITGQIATCNYPLAAASATNDPNSLTVHLNGKTVPQDPVNGWDYTSPAHTAIKLFGSSCDAVTHDAKSKVEVFYACVGQPPVP